MSKVTEHILSQTQTVRSVAADGVMDVVHDEKFHTDWFGIVGDLDMEVAHVFTDGCIRGLGRIGEDRRSYETVEQHGMDVRPLLLA